MLVLVQAFALLSMPSAWELPSTVQRLRIRRTKRQPTLGNTAEWYNETASTICGWSGTGIDVGNQNGGETPACISFFGEACFVLKGIV
jgi:hypothetical protein